MTQDADKLNQLNQEAEQIVIEGQRLYDECGQAYIKASPSAVEKPLEFKSQLQDLLRGLVLKVIHGVVLADRRLSSAELALCRHIFTKLWHRPFTEENARAVLVKYVEQDPYRWEDLLWPFQKLPAFHDRLVEFEPMLLRLAQIVHRVDGTANEHETRYVRWLHSEIERVLHPIRADVTDDPPVMANVKGGSSVAKQVKTSVAKEDNSKPLPVPADLVDLDSLLKELEGLVGLAAVKRDVKELVHFLGMQKQRQKHGLPVTKISLHAIFSGNPGTGKTTVARLYGKLLGALGLLQKGHLIETDRGGLVAEYAGQTATKTAARFDEALDGVLFIDEAYSLVNDGEDPYGAEAVQTLLKRMEDQRDRVVVILAGYPEPMENLLSTNPGLASRFGRTLNFADYSPVELCRIFNTFCQRDHYVLPAATRAGLIDGFTWHWQQRNERFGNGRLARNLFEATLRRLASRLAKLKSVTKAHLCTLEVSDLTLDEMPVGARKDLGQNRYESLCLGCATPVRVEAKELGTEMACQGCQKRQRVEWGEQVLTEAKSTPDVGIGSN